MKVSRVSDSRKLSIAPVLWIDIQGRGGHGSIERAGLKNVDGMNKDQPG
jgi:hypothetical protein